VIYGMPKTAFEAGSFTGWLPLEKVAGEILAAV